MRVYIKDMDMPEHCGECKLNAVYDDETFCPFFTDNVEYWIAAGRRHEDCPLGSFPPHGRLIDADALGKSDRMVGKMMMYGGEYVYTQSEIDRAPTIIEADEGEK